MIPIINTDTSTAGTPLIVAATLSSEESYYTTDLSPEEIFNAYIAGYPVVFYFETDIPFYVALTGYSIQSDAQAPLFASYDEFTRHSISSFPTDNETCYRFRIMTVIVPPGNPGSGGSVM